MLLFYFNFEVGIKFKEIITSKIKFTFQIADVNPHCLKFFCLKIRLDIS